MYSQLAENVGTQRLGTKTLINENVFLVFRALDENVHLRVEPVSWSWTRNADTSRFSFEWSLQMQAYGFAPQGGPVNLLSPLDEYMQKAADAIDLVNAGMGLVANASRNLRSDLDAVVMPLLDSLRNSAIAFNDMREAVGDLSRFPKDVLAHLATTAGAFKASVGRWQEMQDPFSAEMYQPEMERLNLVFGGLAEEADRAAHIGLGAGGGGQLDLAAQEQALDQDVPINPRDRAPGRSTPAGRRLAQYQRRRSHSGVQIMYRVRQGDSLMGLAENALGDKERWTEIAYLNDFQDAYTRHDGSFMEPGEILKLPGDADPVVLGFVLRASTPSELYGVDIYINPQTWDLVPFGKGDIRTISGTPNLEQALMNRLVTNQNEILMFADYGLPISPGVSMSPRVTAYCGAHVRDQLLQDPRVITVENIEAFDEGDKINIAVTITPVLGTTMNVIAPMPMGS